MPEKTAAYSDSELSELITRLEQRVSRLEAALNLDHPVEDLPVESLQPGHVSEDANIKMSLRMCRASSVSSLVPR